MMPNLLHLLGILILTLADDCKDFTCDVTSKARSLKQLPIAQNRDSDNYAYSTRLKSLEPNFLPASFFVPNRAKILGVNSVQPEGIFQQPAELHLANLDTMFGNEGMDDISNFGSIPKFASSLQSHFKNTQASNPEVSDRLEVVPADSTTFVDDVRESSIIPLPQFNLSMLQPKNNRSSAVPMSQRKQRTFRFARFPQAPSNSPGIEPNIRYLNLLGILEDSLSLETLASLLNDNSDLSPTEIHVNSNEVTEFRTQDNFNTPEDVRKVLPRAASISSTQISITNNAVEQNSVINEFEDEELEMLKHSKINISEMVAQKNELKNIKDDNSVDIQKISLEDRPNKEDKNNLKKKRIDAVDVQKVSLKKTPNESNRKLSRRKIENSVDIQKISLKETNKPIKREEDDEETKHSHLARNEFNSVNYDPVDILKITLNKPPNTASHKKDDKRSSPDETDVLRIYKKSSPKKTRKIKKHHRKLLKIGIRNISPKINSTGAKRGIQSNNADVLRVHQKTGNKKKKEEKVYGVRKSRKRASSVHRLKNKRSKHAPKVDVLKISTRTSPNEDLRVRTKLSSKNPWQDVLKISEKTSPNEEQEDGTRSHNADVLRVTQGTSPESLDSEAKIEPPQKLRHIAKKHSNDIAITFGESPNKMSRPVDVLNVHLGTSPNLRNQTFDYDSEEIHLRQVKEILRDGPTMKYNFPPRKTLPLASCFYNKDGYACCNEKLSNLMEDTISNLLSSQKIHPCSIQVMATKLQDAAQREFKHPFETIVSLADFAQNVHFAGDLVCKIEANGKFLLAYGTPYHEENVNATNFKFKPTAFAQSIHNLRI